jgi:hypothetical protein
LLVHLSDHIFPQECFLKRIFNFTIMFIFLVLQKHFMDPD